MIFVQMDYLETAKRREAFNCLGLKIERREDPKECTVHFEKAEDVLGEVTRGLESITSGLGYYLVEDLRGIVETMGFASEAYSREEIQRVTGEVKNILRDMMKLEENPAEVYQDEERRNKLLDACRRMKEFYTEKIPNYRVLGKE